MSEYFEGALAAQTITEVNIAAGEAHQALVAPRSLTRMLWMVLALILLSDLIPIGPLDLGLLPDLHLVNWIFGHPYSHDAGVALYHVVPEEPHVLGVALPWSELF